MRILVAHWRPDIVSGAELAIADVVAKRSNGFEYVMLTPGDGKLAEFYRLLKFPVWTSKVQTPRRKYPGLHSLQSLFFAQKLRRSHTDLILCNTFPAASRVLTACRFARVPCVIYVREYIRNSAQHRRILRQAHRVLAVSHDVADYLNDITSSEKIIVAHDHLDTVPLMERVRVHRSTGKRLLPFEARHPVVGFVGRITSYKQPELLLRAVPLIRERQPEARFVFVGSAVELERDLEEKLMRLSKQLGVTDYVVFMGQRTDAVELISELAVLCLTSAREPFPRTVLEAQLVGCPVVASNTGGCLEMIEQESTGLLFPVKSSHAAEALASQVVRLLQSKDFRNTLARRAQVGIMKGFGSVASVRNLENQLSSVAL